MSHSWGHNGGKIQRHNANNSETIVCGNVRSSAPSTCANMLFQCLSNTASSGNRYSENVPHCSNGKIRNLPFLGPVEYEFVALRGIHCAEVTRGFDTTDLQDTAVYVVKLDPRSLHTQVHVWWLSTAWPYSNADDVHISRSATGGVATGQLPPWNFQKHVQLLGTTCCILLPPWKQHNSTLQSFPPTPPPENISWLRPCTPPEMLSTSNNTFSPLARACSRLCVARNDRDACLIKCRDVGHCVALFSFRASTAFRVRCMQTLSVAIS